MKAIYDPNQLSVVFGGFPISGFAKDTTLEIEHENPPQPYYKITTDIHGNISRTRRVNNSIVKITLTLKRESYSNNTLNNFVEMDRLTNGGVFPILITESNGTTLFACSYAFVSDVPRSVTCYYSNEKIIEWTIQASGITQN